jgi:arylsulfatase A-like enzyme
MNLFKIIFKFNYVIPIAMIISMAVSSCSQNEKSSNPNIIYILSDDLGYNDLGCYGQEFIQTPNIDKLAENGILFTQNYAGSTVCAPSRAALMTGKHIGHNTIRGNVDVLLKESEVTIAEILKNAGYETACIGKWGIGHPPPPDDPKKNGFDYFFGPLSMWHAHNYYPEFLWRNGEKVKLNNVVKRLETHSKEGQEKLTGYATKRVDYTSDLFTEEALKWIENKERPYFLFLSYTIPHANNEAQALGAEHGSEVPDYGIYENRDWPNAEKGKAAMITRLDADIGRLVAKLKELNQYDNTLLIFTSDNGPHMEGGVDPEFFNSNGELRGIKRDLYEGGIRVPMIAVWPGKITPGTSTDHVAAFWDVLPTFAGIVGSEVPNEIDGVSFLPTLLGQKEKQKEHEFLYWEFHEGSSKQAVRIGDWKAVRIAPSLPVEIYDLSNDLSEKNNIADQHPDIMEKAEQLFKSQRTDEDIWPLRDSQSTIEF